MSCRIRSILTSVDRKRAHVTKSIGETACVCVSVCVCGFSRFVYRAHCCIPQSRDVGYIPIVLLDVNNCRVTNLAKQLVSLTRKHARRRVCIQRKEGYQLSR